MWRLVDQQGVAVWRAARGSIVDSPGKDDLSDMNSGCRRTITRGKVGQTFIFAKLLNLAMIIENIVHTVKTKQNKNTIRPKKENPYLIFF